MWNARAALLIAAMLLGSAANAADLPADLAKAVKDYDEAQIHGDKAELQRLVADDYTLVNSSGRIQSKAELIADYTAPGYKIEPFEIMQPVEKVWSDGAVMGGVVDLRGRQVEQLPRELDLGRVQPAELLLQQVQRGQERRALDRVALQDHVELGLVLWGEHGYQSSAPVFHA